MAGESNPAVAVRWPDGCEQARLRPVGRRGQRRGDAMACESVAHEIDQLEIDFRLSPGRPGGTGAGSDQGDDRPALHRHSRRPPHGHPGRGHRSRRSRPARAWRPRAGRSPSRARAQPAHRRSRADRGVGPRRQGHRAGRCRRSRSATGAPWPSPGPSSPPAPAPASRLPPAPRRSSAASASSWARSRPLTTPSASPDRGSFAEKLTIVILGICAAVFAFAVFVRDYPWPDAFMVIIGIAVRRHS